MKNLKSHFLFTKQQRNGIFLLILIIVAVQFAYFYIDLPSKELTINHNELIEFQNEIDSLARIQIENKKPKIYPFNPNFITDYKGYRLGMSSEEINRLLNFRKQNKWINSKRDFQAVTKISDSLLNTIAPYFKFPEWVTNPRPKYKSNVQYNTSPKTVSQKTDLNKATARELQKINGIGEKLSDRIIKFRNKFIGGFIDDVQLQDVYGLSPEVIDRITQEFTVKTPRPIQKINLNNASKDELVTIQHIDYEIAHNILEQRTLREGFKDLNELLKVKDFPVNKIDIIKLYLVLE